MPEVKVPVVEKKPYKVINIGKQQHKELVDSIFDTISLARNVDELKAVYDNVIRLQEKGKLNTVEVADAVRAINDKAGGMRMTIDFE